MNSGWSFQVQPDIFFLKTIDILDMFNYNTDRS